MVATQGLASLLAHKRAKEANRQRAMEQIGAGIQGAMQQIAQARQQQALLEREDQIRGEKQAIEQARYDEKQAFERQKAMQEQAQRNRERWMDTLDKRRKHVIDLAKATGVPPGEETIANMGLGRGDWKLAQAVAKKSAMEQALERAERKREKETHQAEMEGRRARTAATKQKTAIERQEKAREIADQTMEPLRSMMGGREEEDVSPTTKYTRESIERLSERESQLRQAREERERKQDARERFRELMVERDNHGFSINLDQRSAGELLAMADYAADGEMADELLLLAEIAHRQVQAGKEEYRRVAQRAAKAWSEMTSPKESEK